MRFPVLLRKINKKLAWLIPIFILVLGFFVFKDVLAASYWVVDPTSCPSTNQTNYPGQNCDTLDICGTLSGNIAQCYNTASISAPSSGASSATTYSGGLPSGYILDCFATDSSAAGGYCSNEGDWWCNASSTCTTVHRQTDCTANQMGVSTCGTCITGYEYCDGAYTDADGCEIQVGVTATGTNAHYDTGCTATCNTDYFDCNNQGPALTDGCEIHTGSTCVSPSGLIGTYDGCSAFAGFCKINPSYFETGVNVRYATSSPLLGGTQYGEGDLMQLSASNTPGGIFTISNDGRVGIGTTSSALGMNDMLTVGMSAGNQFIVSKSGVVTSGLWQGGIIGLAYGGTGLNMGSSTGFLYMSNGTSTATSTINIGNTNLSVTNTGGSTLLTYASSTGVISLNTAGNWAGTVDGINISSASSTWDAKWDSLADMTLNQGYIYVGDSNNNPVATSSFFISANGNVGIGTTTPTSKLSINGSMNVTGSTTASSLILTGTSTFPANPVEGQLYYRTDTDKLYVYNGSAWKADGQTATFIVAASNSTNKEKADYVCDGTNDEADIEAAIAAAPATGGLIYLLDGTYNIATEINITKSNTKLVGSGPSTVLKITANGTTMDVIDVASAQNVHIVSLRIDGTSGTGGTQNGINFASTAGTSTVDSVEVHNMRNVGVNILGIKNTVKGGIIRNNGSIGIYNSNEDNVIVNNTIKNNLGSGISCFSSTGRSIIQFNDVSYNSEKGISLGSSWNSNISNNLVYYNVLEGISSWGDYSNTISKNRIYGNGAYGMNFYSSNNVVSGNIINYNNGGVSFQSSDSVLFSGNNLLNNGNYELYLKSLDTGNISDNIISGGTAATSTVYFESWGSNSFSNNQVWGHTSGIALKISSGSTENRIGDNYIARGKVEDNATSTQYFSRNRLAMEANDTDFVGGAYTPLMVTQNGTGDVMKLFTTANGTATTTVFTVANNGNIGIGTSTPSQMLTVGATSSQQFLVNNIGQVVGGTWMGNAITNTYIASSSVWNTAAATVTASSSFWNTAYNIVNASSSKWDQIYSASSSYINDSDFTGNGFMVRTASGVYTNRLITGTSSQITITNADGSTGNVQIGLADNVYLGANGKLGRDADNLVDFSTDNAMSFRTNGVDRMVLDANGFLGIGTTTPSNSLTILSSAGSQLRLAYDAYNYVNFGVDSTGALSIISSTGAGTIIGNGVEAMQLDTSGNLILGTSTASAKVTVWGSPNTNFLNMSSTSGASLFMIDKNGNVGIGTSAPSQILTVGATSSKQLLVNNIGQVVGGTWMGSLIGTQYGGTGQNWSAIATGSIPYFSTLGTMTTLTAGSEGQVLKLVGGVPVWSATSTGASHAIFSTDHTDASTTQAIAQGDLLYQNATGKWTNLARGAAGTMLMIQANSPTWVATTTLGITTTYVNEGTNLYYTPARASTTARLAISETLAAIDYDNGTGVLSLNGSYLIPLSASTTNWQNTTNTVNASSTNWTTAYTTIISSSTNWDIGYNGRLQWDGGATNLNAANGRTSLGLGTMALNSTSGSTTITILGTIATGVWQGTAIGNAYIASSSVWNTAAATVTASSSLWQTAYDSRIISTSSNLTFIGNTLGVNAGYVIPLQASTTNWQSAYNTVIASGTNWQNTTNLVNASSSLWNTAYLWGNHALSGYVASSSFSANGIMVRTAAGSYTTRVATGTLDKIIVTNGDGVSGNLTFNLASSTFLGTAGQIGRDSTDLIDFATDNQITFRTNNVSRMVLNTNGYLGIGTTTASQMLTIGATSTQQFLVNNIGQVTAGTWMGGAIGVAYGGTGTSTAPAAGQILIGNGSGGYTFIASSSLGGGTGDPTAIVDADFSTNGIMVRTNSGTYTSVTATGTLNQIIVANGSGVTGNPTFGLASSTFLGTAGQIGRDSTDLIDFATDNLITFRTNNVNRMYLDANGNLMLGTTTAAAKLTILTSTGPSLRLAYSASTFVDFDVNASGQFSITGSSTTGSLIRLGNSLAEDAGLIITGSTSNFWLGLDDTDNVFKIGTGTAIATNSVFSIDYNGKIGVGTSSPSQMLTVGATSSQQFLVNSVGQVIGGTWMGTKVGVTYGGTGTSTAPTAGQILIGNASGGYDFIASSSLGGGGSGDPTALLDADFATNGIMVRTAAGVYTNRTATGTLNQVTVAYGDGVSGNPTFGLASSTFLGTAGQIGRDSTDLIDFATDNQITFRTNNINRMVLNTSGYLGIGTTTASQMLSVGATSSQQFLVNNIGQVTAGTWMGNAVGVTYGGTGTTTAPTLGQILIGNGSGGYNYIASSSLGGGGSGDPTALLDADFGTNGIMVRTAAGVYTNRTATGTLNQIIVTNGSGVSGDPTFRLASSTFLGTAGQIGRDSTDLIDFSTDNQITFRVNNTNRMLLNASGYLGIGTTSPSYMLDISAASGTSNIFRLSYDNNDVFKVTDAQTTIYNPVSFVSAGDTSMAYDLLMVNSSGGNIKFQGPGYITTDSSWQNLDLNLSAANDGQVIISDTLYNDVDISATTSSSYYGTNISLDHSGIFTTGTNYIYGLNSAVVMSASSTGGTIKAYGGYFSATGDPSGSAVTTAYGLYVNGATGADNNYSAVFANGNVGVGTTAPGVLFDLYQGNTVATTTILFRIGTSTGTGFKVDAGGRAYSDYGFISSGADYAEYFQTSDTDLKGGEAVCIDVAKENTVKRCDRGADNDLMGIVSSNPSMIGNYADKYRDSNHYVVVGMLGQVMAKASNENGTIRPGDSLTSSSSTPGVLVRADAGNSTVGVALENLDSASGEVKVLISRRNKSVTVESVEDQITDRIAAMKIEDEVKIMISKAVEDLDLNEKIKPIVDEQIALLNNDINARLTVSLDSINNQIITQELNLASLWDKFGVVDRMFIDLNGRLVDVEKKLASSTALEVAPEATSTTSTAGNIVIATSSDVAVVELDADSDEMPAFVVNQVGDGEIASFRSKDVSIMDISESGKVTVVGEMLVDGRIMICSGGVCGDKLNNSVDETMGDMGVEGTVVAGAFESICDDGYVWVDGSSKYGTLPGFCVEQTESPISLSLSGEGRGEVVSDSEKIFTPLTNVSQGEASLACQTVGKGYHLISENEWLTIADNAIKNNDNDYNKDLAGLQLATTTATSTITMTNGNKLFDFVGGVGEWTDKTITRSELVEPLSADWQEYLAISNYKGLSIAPPYYYNNNENGIGRILTGTSTVSNLRGFVRGSSALFDLDLSHSPVEVTSTIGFRCAK